jgi:hypothetical protein
MVFLTMVETRTAEPRNPGYSGVKNDVAVKVPLLTPQVLFQTPGLKLRFQAQATRVYG